MVLFELSYFDTGCLKKVKIEEKNWFSKTSASHPLNYKQPDQIFKKGCVKKVKTKSTGLFFNCSLNRIVLL